MSQYAWDPDSYLALMAEEIPDYEQLQAAVVDATRDLQPRKILDLGAGSGETARRVLAVHPGADYLGIDSSAPMLDAARRALRPYQTRFDVRRLEDPLPNEMFDLVVSALAVHHLDGPGKADLFNRVRAIVAPGGRFVLADLIVPESPDDVVTPVDGVEDTPSTLAEQLQWLEAADFTATVRWRHRDLAVISAV